RPGGACEQRAGFLPGVGAEAATAIVKVLRHQHIRIEVDQPLYECAGIAQRQHGRDADPDGNASVSGVCDGLPAPLQRRRFRLECLSPFLRIGWGGLFYAYRAEMSEKIEIAVRMRRRALDR